MNQDILNLDVFGLIREVNKMHNEEVRRQKESKRARLQDAEFEFCILYYDPKKNNYVPDIFTINGIEWTEKMLDVYVKIGHDCLIKSITVMTGREQFKRVTFDYNGSKL